MQNEEGPNQGKMKVLAQGDPGMGKMTLAKKLGWDWAKHLFQMFSVVFFIFLKLVKTRRYNRKCHHPTNTCVGRSWCRKIKTQVYS